MKIKRHSFSNKIFFFFLFISVRTGITVLLCYKNEWMWWIAFWVIDLILIYAFWYNVRNWSQIQQLERMVKRGTIGSVQAKVVSFAISSWCEAGGNAFYNIIFEYNWKTYQSAYDYHWEMSLPLFGVEEDLNDSVLTLFKALNIPWFPNDLQQTLQTLETFKSQEDIENYYSKKISSFAKTTLSNLDRIQNHRMSGFMHEWMWNMFEILSMAKAKIEEKIKNWENSLVMFLKLSWTNITINVWDCLPIYFDPHAQGSNLLPPYCLIDTHFFPIDSI